MTVSGPIIAVIDDQTSALRSFARLLAVHGFRVNLYRSAEEFLTEPVTRSVALALIDVNLGTGMSGIDLARTIRESGQIVPIILMSADARSIALAQTEPLPGVTALEKPFAIETLLEVIKISLLC